LLDKEQAATGEKYPELFQWKNAVNNARGQ
jgi:hypothetical protein